MIDDIVLQSCSVSRTSHFRNSRSAFKGLGEMGGDGGVSVWQLVSIRRGTLARTAVCHDSLSDLTLCDTNLHCRNTGSACAAAGYLYVVHNSYWYKLCCSELLQDVNTSHSFSDNCPVLALDVVGYVG